MKRTKVFLVAFVLMALVFFSFQGVALAFNVAYIYGNTESDRLEIALNFLNGNFDSITPIDGDAATLPTLSELRAYDAIMVSPNHSWTYAGRSTELGNLMADYVDAGGGLVMTTFSWQYPDINGLHGRIIDGGYSPFTGGYSLYSFADLGSFTSHPIMEGVNEVSGFYRDAAVPSEDAGIIAFWSDGTPFVAIDAGSGVVGINLFPESYSSEISGDYARLYINALNWAAAHKKQHLSLSGAGQMVFIDGIQVLSILNASYPNDYSHYLLDEINDHWTKIIQQKVGQLKGFAWSRTFEQEDIFANILYAQLEKYSKENIQTGGKLVVVAHSWGTVLAYEACMRNPKIHIDKLITLGSPLNAQSDIVRETAGDDMAEYFIYSVTHPNNVVVWENYWAQCDPISGNIPAADRNIRIKTNYIDPETGGLTCHASYYLDYGVWQKILLDAVLVPKH